MKGAFSETFCCSETATYAVLVYYYAVSPSSIQGWEKFEIEVPISTSIPKSKFRFRHRNFDEISMEFRRNFDFVESKQSKSKPKSKFRFRHRNRNLEKSRHLNFDEIRIKFRWNFGFVESKKRLSWKPYLLVWRATWTWWGRKGTVSRIDGNMVCLINTSQKYSPL
jgi:hypothetical protein